MICPACEHTNKPGREKCVLCTAPLFKTPLMHNPSHKALLSTSPQSSRIYLYLCVLILFTFGYYLCKYLYQFQIALQDQEISYLQQQMLLHKVDLEELSEF